MHRKMSSMNFGHFVLGPNQVCKGGWFEMFWLVYIFSTLWAEQKAIPAWWVLGNQHLGTISRWICYFWHMYVSDLESWSRWNNKHIFKKHMFLFGFKMESARSLYIYTYISMLTKWDATEDDWMKTLKFRHFHSTNIVVICIFTQLFI